MNTADIRAQISRAQELDAKSGLLTRHLATRLPTCIRPFSYLNPIGTR